MMVLNDAAKGVLAAMEALPLKDVALRDRLPEHAFSLAGVVGMCRLYASPRTQETRKQDGVRKEAQAIRDAAARLHRLLEGAHADTLAALDRAAISDPQTGPKQIAPLVTSSHVRMLANLAHVALLDAPKAAAKPGKPDDRVAEAAAAQIAATYELLTGKKPARVYDRIEGCEAGPFHAFLRTVFIATGIDADADYTVRKFVEAAKG